MPIPPSWRRCRSAPRPSWTSGSRRRAPRAWTRPRSSPSSGRSSRRSPRASDRRCLGLPEAPRRSLPRPGRLRRPLRHDGPHRGGRGGALRLQPPPARRLRGDGAHAPRAHLRGTAPRVLLRRARDDGLHRSRAQRWLERGVQLVNGAFMLLLAWLVWLKANRIWGYRDTTDVLRILYGPFVYFMAVTLALAGLIHLHKMLERR